MDSLIFGSSSESEIDYTFGLGAKSEDENQGVEDDVELFAVPLVENQPPEQVPPIEFIAVPLEPEYLRAGLMGNGVVQGAARLGYSAFGSKRALQMEKSGGATQTENQQEFDDLFADLKSLLRQNRPMTFNLASQVIEVEGVQKPYDITKEGEIRRLLVESGVEILTDEAYEAGLEGCENDEERTAFYQTHVCESQLPMIKEELEEIRMEMLALFEEIHPSYGEISRVSHTGIGVENGPNPFTFSSLGAQRFITEREKHFMEMFRNPRNGYVESIPQPYTPDKEKLTPKGIQLLTRMAAARVKREKTLEALQLQLIQKRQDHHQKKEAVLLSGAPNPEIENLEREIKVLEKKINEYARANLFAVDWMMMQLHDELSIKDGNITIRQSAQDWMALEKPVLLGENSGEKTPREWLVDDNVVIGRRVNGALIEKTIKDWITNQTEEHEAEANKVRKSLHLDKEVTVSFTGPSSNWLDFDITSRVAFNGGSQSKTLNEWVLDQNAPQDILDWISRTSEDPIQFTVRNKAYELYGRCPDFPALLRGFDQNVSSPQIRRRLAEKSSKNFNDKIRNINSEPVSSWKFWQEEKARDLTAQEQQEGFTLGSLFFYGMGDQARIANIAYHNDHKMRVAKDSEAENSLIMGADEADYLGDLSVGAFELEIMREGITVEEAFEELFKL